MRVVFIGTGEIGVPTLRALQDSREHELAGVVTQPDKPVGRDQQIQAPPIKAAVAAEKISVLQPARIKDRQAMKRFARCNRMLLSSWPTAKFCHAMCWRFRESLV